MLDLKKIKAAMEALLAEIEAASGDMEKEGATEEAKSAAKKIYEAKSLEYSKFEAQIEEAKKHNARKNKLNEITNLSEVVIEGKSIPAGAIAATVPANPKDNGADERVLEGHFADWFCGKSMPEKAFDALKPTPGFKTASEAEAGHAVRIPARLVRLVMPEAQTVGKALPLTSSQASPANTFQADFRADLLQYPGEAPAIFPRAFKIPTRTGQVKWPALDQDAPGAEGGASEFAEYGHVACAWTAEGAQKPGTEPKFVQRDLKAHELSAKTELSRTLMNRSAINIEGLLPGLFRGSLLHKIDLALISGDGNGKPEGVLTAAGVGAPARTTAAQVKYDDFVNLEHAIAPQLRSGAAWVVADGALKFVKLLKDGQNRPLFVPLTAGAGQQAALGTILGYPVIPTQRTTLGAAGDVIFGNWEHYVCPVEQEIVLLRSEHEKMSSGVVVFVVFMLVGGKVVQARAFSKLPA